MTSKPRPRPKCCVHEVTPIVSEPLSPASWTALTKALSKNVDVVFSFFNIMFICIVLF